MVNTVALLVVMQSLLQSYSFMYLAVASNFNSINSYLTKLLVCYSSTQIKFFPFIISDRSQIVSLVITHSNIVRKSL